jgi:hypothetical protein
VWIVAIQTLYLRRQYFQTLTQRSENDLTIAGRDAMIVGSGRATITLSNGTQVMIKDALLYPDSTRTLISFRDIRKSGLHVCVEYTPISPPKRTSMCPHRRMRIYVRF